MNTKRNVLLVTLLATGPLTATSRADLIVRISKDSLNEAVVSVSASGSTVSTTQGSWDEAGRASGSFGFVHDFARGRAGNFNNSPVYAFNDFRLATGVSITAGTDTRILDRFEFEDGGGGDFKDDWSMAFGDGTNATPWNTTTTSVGQITVNDTSFHKLLINGNPIKFDDYFNSGVTTTQVGAAGNVFWGGVTLTTAAVPAPSSLFPLAIGIAGMVGRRRRSSMGTA